MSEWRVVRLGDLFNVKSSKRIYASEYVEDGVPFYRSREIIEIRKNKKITSPLYISESRYKELAERHGAPKKGDILITSVGTIGTVWFVEQDKFYFKDGNLNWIESNIDEVTGEFIYYWLDSSVGYNNIINQTIGTSQSALTLQALKKLKIYIPNKITMEKISNVLSTYDKLIENNNRRIQILEQTAEELYKEWFVRMRFPGYENTKFDKGIPEGWGIKKVEEIISFDIGGGWGEESRMNDFTEQAYVIRGTDIPNMKYGEFNYELLRYHKKSNLKSRKLESTDIIFEASGGSKDQRLGRTFYVTKEILSMYDNDVICASFCKLIKIEDKYLSWFFYNYLRYAYQTEILSTFEVQSTGISNFGFSKFKKHHQLLVPTSNVMEQFYNLTYPILVEIQKLGNKNQNLIKQRDLLLPRLMNGTITVK